MLKYNMQNTRDRHELHIKPQPMMGYQLLETI